MSSSASVILVMHTTSYNVEAFLDACRRADARPVLASDRCHVLDGAFAWPPDSVVVDFSDPAGAAQEIADRVRSGALPPVRAAIPVGGETVARAVAVIARCLGLLGNASSAVEATGNKLRMRELCAAALEKMPGTPALLVPRFRAFRFDADPVWVAEEIARDVGWPCVVKPLLLSGSRGVIRADDAAELGVALSRLRTLLSTPALLSLAEDGVASRQVLIESFVGGPEVAVEGVLTDGELQTLAFFDKPDPLDGPFFEETIYVTPSRHPAAVQASVERVVRQAAHALGLVTGPVHAEVRLDPRGPVVIEVAARSIGGLCSRTLRFGTGLSLEELLIRHALGHDVRALGRERGAAGVMMIPIPAAGVLIEVRGVPDARALPGIEDVVISMHPGEALVPLPEGASYLGFIFARGPSPADVEARLRQAHGLLSFEIAPRLPLAR